MDSFFFVLESAMYSILIGDYDLILINDYNLLMPT